MRSVLLMVGAVVVIALGAGVYIWMQPPAPVAVVTIQPTTHETPAPPPPPPPAPATSPNPQPVIGAGTGVWTQVFDEKTSKLSWQSRFDRHEPQPDGSVNVTNPQAEFFLDDGQVIVIAGTRGRVVIPGEAARDPNYRGSTPRPSRGELYDVIITVYPDDKRERQVLQCRVNNLAFDNDTLRIATEAMRNPDGTIVPGEQIPVQVRGAQYDFDGRGLTIRWNGRDRRLQSLEIAHGQSMTIKPAPPAATPTTTAPPATQHAAAASPPATPTPQRGAAVAAAPSTRPATQPAYRVTFNRDVVVTRGNEPLAIADTMQLDYRLEEREPPKTAPASPARRGGAVVATPPASQPRPQMLRGPLAPTAKESDQTTVINWTGKLTVVPVPADAPALQPSQGNIELTSQNTPVKVTYLGNVFTAASLTYGSRNDAVAARSSEQVPVVTLIDSKGTEISTRSLHLNGVEGKVKLDGPSTAKIMMDGVQPNTREAMTTRWDESCLLTLAKSGKDDFSIERADIAGNVRIEHPKLTLQAKTLRVDFAPALPGKESASAQLKQLDAAGDVKCDIFQDPLNPQQISAETLTLTSAPGPDGKLVPRTLVADGQVHTFDKDQDVRAGHVEATLGPATRPTDPPALERLTAQRDVVFKRGPASGSAGQLEVTASGPDEYELKMSGQPYASVSDGNSTLNGPIINVSQKRQHVQVVGPGTLRSSQAATAGSTPANVDLAWGSELNLDALANTAQLSGGVRVNVVTPDRTTIAANSDKLLLDMADAPATTKPSTKPSHGELDLFSSKEIRSFTFDGDTRVQAVVADTNGSPLQRIYLEAPQVKVEPLPDRSISRVTIPAAGRMLYEDLQPTTRPATEPATADLGDFSGPTAFQWSKQLIFDQVTQQAKMSGDVSIAHETETGEPFRLQSEQVTAHFMPATMPTTRPAAPELQRFVADGGVQFTSRQIIFTASEMDFDPTHQTLAAFGADGAPVQIFDNNGVSTGSVKQASWNTKTQAIEVRDLQIQFRK